MSELNTISDSKEAFFKEFPYVIPHVFRKVADEMIVELHLLKHQKSFVTDSIFCVGLTTAFKELTKGYEPSGQIDQLFEALCKANKIDPKLVKEKASKSIDRSKILNLEDLLDFSNLDSDKKNIFKSENDIYNRLTIIGIYTIVKDIVKDNSKKDANSIETITKNICNDLSLPKERVDKDISLYINSKQKIKQALELIKLINKK